MDLEEFFNLAVSELKALYEWADTTFPFKDFPQLSYWELFLSSSLVMILIHFIPSLDEDEVAGEIDFFAGEDTSNDSGNMESHYDDDDFDF